MNKIYVALDSLTTRDYWDGEQYGEWETQYQYNGCNVCLAEEARGRIGVWTQSVDVDFEPKVGQIVFPIIVQYGSGDSFGHSSGNTTIAAVVDTPEKAMAVRDAIYHDSEKNGSSFASIEVEGLSIYPGSWKGYFENLEAVIVETETVRI